jgi:hypothetical protein
LTSLRSPDGALSIIIKAVGRPAAQRRPDLATLDFAAMNAIAGETGQPVVGPPMTAEEAAAIVERER